MKMWDRPRLIARSRTFSWFDAPLLLALILSVALFAEDLFAVVVTGGAEYPIGWEGGGWSYRTLTNYVVSAAFLALAGVVAIALYLVATRTVLRFAARATGLYAAAIWVSLLAISIAGEASPIGQAALGVTRALPFGM